MSTPIELNAILNQNITLVYDLLDLKSIDTRQLKTLLNSQTGPMLMDTPEMIVAVYPSEQIVLQIGDNRIRITLQKGTEDVSNSRLGEFATKCHKLVPKNQSKLTAYGFNYDLLINAHDSSSQLLKDLFVKDEEKINSILEGTLQTIVPRLRFTRNKNRYDLILEPVNDSEFKAHMNAHFVSNQLPTTKKIKLSFEQEYSYLVEIMLRVTKRSN